MKKESRFNFNFVEKFKVTSVISIIAVIASLVLIGTKGLNYGVDFKGGAEIQMKFSESTSGDQVRKAFSDGGVKSSSVQTIGDATNNEFLIKLQTDKTNVNEVTNKATKLLSTVYGNKVEVRKTDVVGPKAGEQLRLSGFLAMLWALLGIMVYIGLRFDFKYSPGAIVALFHDVVIILGVFALTDKEFSLQIVGALLAVIGYSVNDTVVVFDRVREYDTGVNLKKILNKALNETLSRTVLTSVTTLLVSVIMFAMGGGVIQDFFFAISLGVIIGTYSSLFVASPVTLVAEKLLSGDSKSKATA